MTTEKKALFQIDSILKNVELKQRENIVSSAINKSLTETITYTYVTSVKEGKVIVSVYSYFKNLQD